MTKQEIRIPKWSGSGGVQTEVLAGYEGGGATALVDPLEGVHLCGEAEGLMDVVSELLAGAACFAACGVEEGMPVGDLGYPEWGGWEGWG